MPKNIFSSELVQVELDNQVAELTITREAALNALSFAVLSEMEAALLEVEKLPLSDVRLLILRGSGQKAFVAGADIREMQEASAERLHEFINLGQRVMRRLEKLAQPTIAVVQGFALGGGLELALACDLIFASSNAKVGQPEVNLGLIPGFGGTQRLAARVGIGTAKRLIYTAETVKADEALRMGLIDYVVEAENLEQALGKCLSTLLTKGPLALKYAKQAIEAGYESQKAAGLKIEVEAFLKLFSYADTKEGLLAFLEKRSADFKGE